MKKHLAIGFGAALTALIALIGIAALRKSEPVYQGRHITDWIRDGNLLSFQSPLAPQRIQARAQPTVEARIALRAIGSNAIPYLVHDLGHEDSLCKKAWLPLWQRLPPRIKNATAAWSVPDWRVRANAAKILGELSPVSRSALPDLVKALADPAPGVQNAVMDALVQVGANPDQLMPELQARLQNPVTRSQVLLDLTRFMPGGELTAQILADVFSVSNAADQQEILYFLERIGPQAKWAVPALIAALSRDDKEIRYLAIRALRAIGPGAQTAVPALSARLNDASSMVRNAAARALKIIAPETNLSPPANH